MEFSTFHSDLADTEIKPNALLMKYMGLLERENQAFFPADKLQESGCPSCGAKNPKALARKMGHDYGICGSCRTLFVARRPTQDQIMRFFRESEARRFWLKDIWNETASVRHEKILEPLKTWVETFIDEAFPGTKPVAIAEMNASNWGFWETIAENPRIEARLVEPMFDTKLKSEIDGAVDARSTMAQYDAICLIDALARVESPMATLQWASQHLKSGGLCFITTTLSTGFDVQVLGAASEALLPPDRLTLLSLEGLRAMAEKSGLEVVELSTPGVLDLQNVQRAAKGGAEIPAFVRYLLETRANDPRFTYDFQTFLQSHGLSSQGRLVLRKS